MKTRGFLLIKILVCAMFISVIAYISAVRGDDPVIPSVFPVVESSESPVYSVQRHVPSEGAELPLEPQASLQNITPGCELRFSDPHFDVRLWVNAGLIMNAIMDPTRFGESDLEEMIEYEPCTLSDQRAMKNKLIERTQLLVDIIRGLDEKKASYSLLANDLANDLEDARWRILYLENINRQTEYKYRADIEFLERLTTAFNKINEYHQDLDRQMITQRADKEIRDAVLDIEVTFSGTIEDVKRLGVEVPPIANPSDAVHVSIIIPGTLVNIGEFGRKIVIARHAFYIIPPKSPNVLKYMTYTIIEPPSNANNITRHAISLERLREFPNLDLVVLDVPSSLSSNIKPLPLSNVDSYETFVSQIYSGENYLYSQVVKIHPMFYALPPDSEYVPDDLFFVSARIIPGDSGRPLVVKENGEIKVVGFILAKYNNDSGGGIAVKASRLLDNFFEFEIEFQRPQ